MYKGHSAVRLHRLPHGAGRRPREVGGRKVAGTQKSERWLSTGSRMVGKNGRRDRTKYDSTVVIDQLENVTKRSTGALADSKVTNMPDRTHALAFCAALLGAGATTASAGCGAKTG